MVAEVEDDGRPVWDSKRAEALIGGIVIVGMTYVDVENRPLEQFQYHGVIVQADPRKGIAIECHGKIYNGQTVWLPPVLRAFQPAKPGQYRLRSTGEVVRDPDYTCSFSGTRSAKDRPQ